MSSCEGRAASDTSTLNPIVDPSEPAAMSSDRAPSCGEVEASEASMALRHKAQVDGFNAGWWLGVTCRPYVYHYNDDDDGDNSPVLPTINWRPCMYRCYKYASKKSGNSVHFEDENGNVIKVIRARPIVGLPRSEDS